MFERLGRFWSTVAVILSVLVVLLSVNQIFYLSLFGFTPIFEGYLYFVLACLLPLAFIFFPISKAKKDQKPQWYDAILFIFALIFPFYLGLNGERIVLQGWETNAPL